MNGDLLHVIEQIGREKGIDREVLIEAVKSAIVSASKKRLGQKADNLEADFDNETGQIRLFISKSVVTDLVDADNEILLEDAIKIDPDASVESQVDVTIEIQDFGRIAAQTAKQIIVQKVREAERELVFNEFDGRQGELTGGIFQREEKGNLVIDLGKAEAILPKREQSFRESFRRGERIRAYIVEVKKTIKGPQIILSRTHPGFLVKLFEMEVPEVEEGIIEIKEAAREPTGRSKIAVVSNDKDVDPVGACVGIRGSRVQSIVQELRGEKIDIVEWSEDPEKFARNALSPAKVSGIMVDKENRSMIVIVDDDQLSLSIGKKGQNVRLAARLTHWKIDIKSQSQYDSEKEGAGETAVAEEKGEAQSLEQLSQLLGEKKIASLIESGFKTIDDIKEADIEAIKAVKGFGEKTAEKVKQEAENYVQEEINDDEEEEEIS